MDQTTITKMTPMQAIKAYFEADGGRQIQGKEILDLKKGDPEGYDEIKNLVAAALGVELETKTV